MGARSRTRQIWSRTTQRGSRRAITIAALVCGVMPAMIAVVAGPAEATAQVFTASLTGDQEVPPSGSTGTGVGRVYLNAAETQITIDLSWSGLGTTVVNSHIHGPAGVGVNAGVLFALGAGSGGTTGNITTTTAAITADQVTQLKAGLFYFNVHTTGIGTGEIRGQISATAPSPQQQLFVATLRGVQENPVNGSTGTGFGTVYLNSTETQITVDLRWSGLSTNTTAGGAHIHGPALPGTNAAIPFPLSGVPITTTGSVPTQTFAVNATQLAQLKAGLLYFNVHTTAIPGGEIRGQIHPGQSLPAFVRTSTEWRHRNAQSTGSETTAFSYGTGQRPLTVLIGDWDGNGTKTPAYYKSGVFNRKHTLAGGTPDSTVTFGTATGYPVAGDFDGNAIDDVAVFKNGTWEVRLSTGATSTFTFGTGSWPATVPVVGDWDGDGIDGIATYNRSTATWDLRNTATMGAADAGSFAFGTANASYPVVGDWNGDGIDSVGVKSTTSATWSLRNTNAAGSPDISFDYGLANDLPLVWR